MSVSLDEWDARIHALFGLSMRSHPARLRDGILTACAELSIRDETELLARVDRADRRATDALARALTIGESYFFREPAHFDLLRTRLLPAALERSPGSRVVLCSAGCSRGEEAYSMAIVACEVAGANAGERVAVVGYDLNDRAVEVARRGTYRRWSLRGVGPSVLRRWFEPQGDRLRVTAGVRALATFERKNLVDPSDAIPPATIDIVFCRNVLIYFDEAAIAAVLGMLERALRPGGVLVVGSAEVALLAHARLASDEIDGVWVHTKGAVARARSSMPPPPPTSRPSRPAPPPRPRTESRRREPPAPPKTEGAAPPTAPAETASPERCVERGFAMLASDPAGAAAEARRAILLDRSFAAAHVLAAAAAMSQRDHAGARRAIRRARRHLAELPPCTMVAGTGGATAADMHAYCARLMRALGDER